MAKGPKSLNSVPSYQLSKIQDPEIDALVGRRSSPCRRTALLLLFSSFGHGDVLRVRHRRTLDGFEVPDLEDPDEDKDDI